MFEWLGKSAPLLLIVAFLASVVIAIVYVNSRSKCKLPDDNTCQIDPSTGLQLYPYCPDESGEYQCAPADTVCTNTDFSCTDPGQERYCDWKNSSYACRDSGGGGGGPPGGGGGDCSVLDEDGNLPYPRHKGNIVDTTVSKPENNYDSYSFSTFGGGVCELATCKDGYEPIFQSADSYGWCRNTNFNTTCLVGNDGAVQYPGDDHNPHDPNAEYKIYYEYPGDKKYCKFSNCESGWDGSIIGGMCQQGQGLCVGKSPPAHATKYTCDPDTGVYTVTKCQSTDTIVYGPTDDGQACEAKSCVTVLPGEVRKLPNCDLDPQNETNIITYLFGGKTPSAQCALDTVKTNVKYDTTTRKLKVNEPDRDNNPYGGCGSDKCSAYYASSDGLHCNETPFQHYAIFNWRGNSKTYDENIDEGCIECPTVFCPPGTTDKTKCGGYQENCGLWETSTSNTIDDVITSCTKINKDQLSGSGFMFGEVQPSGLKNLGKTSVAGAPLVVDPDNMSIIVTGWDDGGGYCEKVKVSSLYSNLKVRDKTDKFPPSKDYQAKVRVPVDGWLQVECIQEGDGGFDNSTFFTGQDIRNAVLATRSNIIKYKARVDHSYISLQDNDGNSIPMIRDTAKHVLGTYFQIQNGKFCLGSKDNSNLVWKNCNNSDGVNNRFLYNKYHSNDDKTNLQYMLIDPNGGTHCIDLPGGKQGSDKGLTLATCHGKDDDWHHQVWDKPKSDGRIKYSRSDGGGYFFYNKDNKLVIEGSSSSGDPNAVMKINNLS